MSIFTFSNPILLGGVRAGAFVDNTMGLKENTQGVVEVLCAIITMQYFDGCIKLVFNHMEELHEC